MRNMGLAYDANTCLKMPNKKIMKSEQRRQDEKEPGKLFVVSELEEDAHAPRERGFRLPNGQVEWITYLLDKYGEDYKAMAQDKKNYYQETWKQLRAKVKQFKGIPQQYNVYLASKISETQGSNEKS